MLSVIIPVGSDLCLSPQFLELDFLPNPPRGCSYFYGYAALKPFLESQQLLGIIRAHQCKEEVGGADHAHKPHPLINILSQGVSYSYTDNREVVFPFPYVTTVFSASNYCGSYGNKGAVMIFYPDDIQVCASISLQVPFPYCHVPFPYCHSPCFQTQVLKFSSSGETWVEKAPYHSPDITVPVKPVKPVKQEKEEVVSVVVETVGGAEEGGAKPYIPPPPPLPPIMAPVPEEEVPAREEEEEEEEREKEGEKV